MLTVIKIGGNVVDSPEALASFLKNFSSIKGPKILVHGGGKIASEFSTKLGITPTMLDGRRITDEQTLDVVTMVYAGLLNKKIVALLQALHCNALGLSGADGNAIETIQRAPHPINYGLVGDVKTVSQPLLQLLISNEITPVFCAITHNAQGQLLNTNADTIASSLAVALASSYNTRLIYCFEKIGVLTDVNDENTLVPDIDPELYTSMKANRQIYEGMIPKLDHAFDALRSGVGEVVLCSPEHICTLTKKTRLHL